MHRAADAACACDDAGRRPLPAVLDLDADADEVAN